MAIPLLGLRSGGMSGGRGFSGRSGGGYTSGGGSGYGSRSYGNTTYGLGSNYGKRGYFESENGYVKESKYDIWVLIGFIVLLFVPLIVFMIIKKKKTEKSEKILEEIATIDESWDIEEIKKTVKKIFYDIINAKVEKTYDIKDIVSNSFYLNFKAKIDGMRIRNEKYVISNIEIKDIRIVEVTDYKDDSKDRFWAYIVVHMVHFIVNERNEIIEGYEKPDDYKQLWNFMRGKDNSWILREILDDPEEHMHKFKSFSEELQ